MTVKVDAHSELMGAYPWGFSGVTPERERQPRPTTAQYDGRRPAVHRRRRAPRRAGARLRGAGRLQPLKPRRAATGAGFRGPQPGTAARAPSRRVAVPSACDDGPFGNGTGGELTYQSPSPRAARRRVVAVAGSDQGLAARAERARRSAERPGGALAAKMPRARSWRAARRSRCRATRCCRTRSTGASRTSPTSRRPRANLQIRWTNQGKQFPAAARHRGARALVRRRLPRLPVDVRHRRRVHDLRGGRARPVRGRRGAPARAARRLGRPQQPLGRGRPRGRDRRLGLLRPRLPDDQPTAPRRTTSTPTRSSSSRARWRWSGAGPATTVPRRDVRLRRSATCTTSTSSSTPTTTAGPRVRATSSGPGMGPEKLDNAVYYIRGLVRPRRHGPRPSTTARPFAWATSLARKLQRAFERTWWDHGGPAVRRLAQGPGQRPDLPEALDRRDADGGRADTRTARRRPGSRRTTTATTALAGRENNCYSGDRPVQPRPVPHRLRRRRRRQGRAGDLLADDRHPGRRRGQLRAPGRRPAAALHRTPTPRRCSPSRRPAGRPDEQPGRDAGDLPVARTATGEGTNIDRCWTCRSMFMQAWGNYGTAWPVVHQQLGVRPVPGRRPARGRAAGAATASRACRVEHPARRAARSTCSRRTRARATRPRSTRGARRARAARSATRCRAAPARDVRLDGIA